MKDKYKIAIIGLGYVGLPLAVEFGKKYNTFGFDINHERVNELIKGIDITNECTNEQIKLSKKLVFTKSLSEIKDCNIYIITVPTPINKFKSPELKYLLEASKMVGKLIGKGDIVIYESTVYPGCTEEDCVPVLEKFSKLKFNKDFFCGYSPERINPGDKIRTIDKIVKVTSGSDNNTAEIVDSLYASIITAGTHKATSIKVAEASKAIENAQRDLNISFVNELSLIFEKMNIDTTDVLNAASTKWNFLNFKPGLVGGHCISVDPYYLTHKAQSLGYYPDVILSGRRVNDIMASNIVDRIINLMIQKKMQIKNSKALILGFTFKENCPDIRNTKVIDIYNEFLKFGIKVDICDPHAKKDEVLSEYKINIIDFNKLSKYDVILLAVGHNEFKKIQISDYKNNKSVVFDVKSFLDRNIVDKRL